MRVEQIGDCTLYLGDAVNIVDQLETVGAVITDPPFGMDFKSNYRTISHAPIAGDIDERLLIWACNIPIKHSRYVFCRWDNLVSVPKPKSFITWVKNNWSMGDLDHEHARQTETILFYAGKEHFFPKKRPQDVIKAPRTGNEYHPTQKPVGLMAAIVEWTDGVVLDPFMGSGSTGMACAKMGRKFIGCELNEEYFEVACERISKEYDQPDMFRRTL